ncbi:MAG: hypothetical protein R3B47_21660 [Bacteroidia bacterium]
MKNALRLIVMIAACLIFAGCPDDDSPPLCSELTDGEACAYYGLSCICINEVTLNGVTWVRENGAPDIQFPIDSRNMNTIKANVFGYSVDYDSFTLVMRADLNGDGTVADDEVFFSQNPDSDGFLEASFQVPMELATLHSGHIKLERDEAEVVAPQPLCIIGPRGYIQVGNGGTFLNCDPDIMHFGEFSDVRDCYYSVNNQFPFSIGMAFDSALISPGSTVPIQITSLKYLDTGVELMTSPVTTTVQLESSAMSGLLFCDTASFINFSVPVDASVGAGDFQITFSILDENICDGVRTDSVSFNLEACPACRR